MTLPVSFKEFVKQPVKAVLFLSILAIGYLYVDIKMTTNQDRDNQNKRIELLENKVNVLTNQLKTSDSTMLIAITRLEMLKQMGKIK